MKIKLTENNIKKYLNKNKLFKKVGIWSVEEITEHTNVNFVFKVTTDSDRYPTLYMKQAFPFVKIKPDFAAPIERQHFEYKALKYFQKENIWKNRIPDVIDYDKKNNVLILSDVGEGANLLVNEVNKKKLHLECASDLGKLVAELHSKTYKKNDYPIRDKKTNQEHIDFILDFRLRGAMEVCPKETKKLFEASQNVDSSLLFGDWPHKNLYITNKNTIRIVDFENVVRFDPAADIGYALADWLLEKNKKNINDIDRFIRTFVKAYSSTFQYKQDLQPIFERSTKYLGAMMLHRLVGVKNTNKKEEYLERGVDLIGIGKILLNLDNTELSECPKAI
jgi:thiamine kinase-like enzyme